MKLKQGDSVVHRWDDSKLLTIRKVIKKHCFDSNPLLLFTDETYGYAYNYELVNKEIFNLQKDVKRLFQEKQDKELSHSGFKIGDRVRSNQPGYKYTGTIIMIGEYIAEIQRDGNFDTTWACKILPNGEIATALGLWDNKSKLELISSETKKKTKKTKKTKKAKK